MILRDVSILSKMNQRNKAAKLVQSKQPYHSINNRIKKKNSENKIKESYKVKVNKKLKIIEMRHKRKEGIDCKEVLSRFIKKKLDVLPIE